MSLAVVLLVALGIQAPPATSATAGAGDAIENELASIRASVEEERWRLVPWRSSLTDTLAQAARANRPVFFFGADGDLDTGNC